MIPVRVLVVAMLAITVGCSGPAPEPPKTPAAKTTSHAPPKDVATKFPLKGQVKMQLVPDHLLNRDFMPGGNLADYKTADGQYQMFLLEAPDARAAAFLLLDWKNAVPEARYIAHMGGYTWTDQGKTVYIFAKGPFLAGIVGLPEDKADAEARRFAAKL